MEQSGSWGLGGDHSFIFFHVDFIADADECKVLWIARRSLNEKLVFPVIQVFE